MDIMGKEAGEAANVPSSALVTPVRAVFMRIIPLHTPILLACPFLEPIPIK